MCAASRHCGKTGRPVKSSYLDLGNHSRLRVLNTVALNMRLHLKWNPSSNAYTVERHGVLIAVSLWVSLVCVCVVVFLCWRLIWKLLLHQCHRMLHEKAKLTRTLSFLFCCHSLPLSVLRCTPVIIAFVTATIIQICLGKLLQCTSDHLFHPHIK